jgi:hypothetical protein
MDELIDALSIGEDWYKSIKNPNILHQLFYVVVIIILIRIPLLLSSVAIGSSASPIWLLMVSAEQ